MNFDEIYEGREVKELGETLAGSADWLNIACFAWQFDWHDT